MSDKKLTIDDIEVPREMLAAAWSCWIGEHGVDTSINTLLKHALLWLAENPTVPTNKEGQKLWNLFSAVMSCDETSSLIATEWQRRMFLKCEPELPEEVKALLLKHGFVGSHFEGAPSSLAKALTEAYALGKKAGAK